MFRGQVLNNRLTSGSDKPLLAALLMLVAVMSFAIGALYLLAKSQATSQVEAQAERLANSVETLLTPLMLSDDRVSLNFIVNQLVEDPSLRGLRLTDSQQLSVAIAGEPAEIKLTRTIEPNGERLGELTLWIDPLPALTLLKSQLIWVALSLSAALILAALTYRYTPREQLNNSEADEPLDFEAELERAYGEDDSELDNHSEHRTEPLPSTYQPEPENLKNLEGYTEEDSWADLIESSDARTEGAGITESDNNSDNDNDRYDLDPDAPLSFDTLDLSASRSETDQHLNQWPTNTESDIRDDSPQLEDNAFDEPLSVSPTLKAPLDDIPTIKAKVPQQDPTDDRVDLVDLLRPEHDQTPMPRFKPSAKQPIEENWAEEPESEELEISIPVPVNTAPRSRKLPIITEEQLDLYTLEQELDLILAPEHAGYLILIDTTSAHSPNLDLAESQQIRRTYRTLANSVARIYQGKVETLGDDILIRFDLPNSDDSHGVNALCSALLFNLLYRSYNQSRTKQEQPLLNVHIAIVRGQINRFDHLLDEARFLTRSTRTQQLISHTALSEAPELKASLLSSADVRREDEDKVLINSIEKRHQTLLEKQARYLLAKLAERANQRSRAADARANESTNESNNENNNVSANESPKEIAKNGTADSLAPRTPDTDTRGD